MEERIYQQAGIINQAEKQTIIYILGERNKDSLMVNELGWDFKLGMSYHKFSYLNEIITMVGRDVEKEWLYKFLETEDKFKVSAITGRAGNGKSSLVYNFYKYKSIEKGWSVYGVDYDALEKLNYVHFCELVEKKILKSNILLAIDYVLINATEIGKWIVRLYKDCAICKTEIRFRILLIERAHVTDARKPFWYLCLVENNKLQDWGLGNYKEYLQLDDLDDDNLVAIFVRYCEKNRKEFLKRYEEELDLCKCKEEATAIICSLEKECKTPLYILYIADSWINNKANKGRNWSKEDSLCYVINKENERIKSFFKNNNQKEACLIKIISFAMAVDGINLGKEIPSFLKDAFKEVRKELGDGIPNLRHIFSEIGELKNERGVILKSALPEVVEEYYCLEYLENILYNAFDDDFVDEFIQQAWTVNSRAFAGFLCRIIEDFPKHRLVNFSGILRMPMVCEMERKVLYANMLREYTFWNDEIECYSGEILNIFDKLIENEKCREVLIEVCEKYAIVLFNMLWWCWQNTNENKVFLKEVDIFFIKMHNVCHICNDNIICQACRWAYRMFPWKKVDC